MLKKPQLNIKTSQLLTLVGLLSIAFQTFSATRWYQVEMIVFKQNHSATTVKEPLPDNTILPDPSSALPLNHSGIPSQRLGDSVAFKLLPRSMFAMKDYYNRLSAAKMYEPVAHIAWRQPVPFSRNGKKLQLRFGRIISGSAAPVMSENNPNNTNEVAMINDDNAGPMIQPSNPSTNYSQVNEFNGTLTISRLRYLHFDVDLAFHDTRLGQKKIYRMQENRRMRSKVVHLLDHPMFGIIVYMTPLK